MTSAKPTPPESPTSRAAWVRALALGFAQTLPWLSSKSKLLAIAHMAHESGFGASAPSAVYNFASLTAGQFWRGPTMTSGDLEYERGSDKPKRIQQKWRAYPSLHAGLVGYWSFLSLPRYARARTALTIGDPRTFVAELYDAGYFTLPPEKYAAGLVACLQQVTAILEPTKEKNDA